MSNAWTAIDSSSWFGTSWVCDVGVFTSGATLIPPAWLPAGVDEIDLMVTPYSGEPLEGFTPVYPNYHATYRLRSGLDEFTGDYGFSGYAPAPTDHLLVIVYMTGYPSDPTTMPRPSRPPLGLVPKGLVAGAWGPYRGPSHWSDWQDGITVDSTATHHHVGSGLWNSHDWSSLTAPVAGGSQGALDAALASLEGGTGYRTNGLVFQPAAMFNWGQDGGGSGGAEADVSFQMFGANLDGSAAVAFPFGGVTPPLPPDGSTDGVPTGPLVTGAFEFESGTGTLISWHDITLSDRVVDVLSSDYLTGSGTEGSSFTPPTDFPLSAAFGAPVSEDTLAGSDGGDGQPFYIHTAGPPRLADFTLLGRTTVPCDVSGGTYSPYSCLDAATGAASRTATPADVTIPMAAADSLVLSVVLFPRYLDDAGWTVPAVAVDERQHWDPILSRSGVGGSLPFSGVVPTFSWRQPRWRYWELGALVFPPQPGAALRLSQRNDGLGSARHPRLLASQSPPSSVQRNASPRLGRNNRYR